MNENRKRMQKRIVERNVVENIEKIEILFGDEGVSDKSLLKNETENEKPILLHHNQSNLSASIRSKLYDDTDGNDPIIVGYEGKIEIESTENIEIEDKNDALNNPTWMSNLKNLFQGQKSIPSSRQSSIDEILGDAPINTQHIDKERLPVDILFIIIHGIGTKEEMLKNMIQTFHSTLTQVIEQAYWSEKPIVIETKSVYWKNSISSFAEQHRRLFVSQDSLRVTLQDYIGDVIYFMTHQLGDSIIHEAYNGFEKIFESINNNSRYTPKTKIALCGHSLGSVILYELVSGIRTRPGQWEVARPSPPSFTKQVDAVFFWGSPAAGFISLSNEIIAKGIQRIHLPLYNIFHPNDPVAFRFEPLLYPNIDINVFPRAVRIPHWETKGDSYIYSIEKTVKETIKGASGVVLETIKKFNTTSNVNNQTNESQLERNNKAPNWGDWLSSRIEKFSEILDDDYEKKKKERKKEKLKLSAHSETDHNDDVLSNYSNSVELEYRTDYMLQEEATDRIVRPIGYLRSHLCYWTSKDLGLFMIKNLLSDTVKMSAKNWDTVIKERRRAEFAEIERKNRS